MFVTVEHHISDAEKFWNAAERELPKLSQNLKLHVCTPSKDGKTAYCIWEVDSVESLKDWMENTVGDVSQNEYHEVNEEMAMGLSNIKSASQFAAT
jgi:hypothetical protein